MVRKRALAVLLIAPLFLFFAPAAEEPPSSGSSGMLGNVVNFVILAGALLVVLRKPIRDLLDKRTRDIEIMIVEAQEARRDALAKLEEAQKRAALLDDEIARIRQDAQVQGLREKERIRALGEKEVERIRIFAEQEIDLLLKAGIQELKNYTAELAAALAETRLQQRITQEDHAGLIDKSIERLAERHEIPDSR